MSTAVLSLEALGGGALLRADARLEAGLWVAQSANPHALAALVALASGVETPARGRVLLDGVSPAGRPEVRARIAALLAAESLPPGRDVRTAVGRVLRARGDRRDAGAMLELIGMSGFARRPVIDLDAMERRALALGLALEHPTARLFALFEPFSAHHLLSPPEIQRRLEERARSSAIVLVATASPAVAALLGGAHLEIESGLLRPAVPRPPLGVPALLYVETPEAQRLVSAVASDAAVTGVFWNERETPRMVTLYGADLEALGHAVTRAAAAGSVPIDRIGHAPAATREVAPATSPATNAPPPLPASAIDPQAARPSDQSVAMPTSFAVPARPGSPEGT
ncbi:MAG TPA: hypothetical protein VGK73_29955 [Polyangiaceae bacterium]